VKIVQQEKGIAENRLGFEPVKLCEWLLWVRRKADDVIRRSPSLENKKRDIIEVVEKLPA
jgi:hypothetical protein